MIAESDDSVLIASLVQRSRGGDRKDGPEAYGLLVQRFEAEIRALLRALCKNHAQADDLAQDAFVSGWQNLNGLQDPTKFLPWIKRLSYRLFLHAERRRKVEGRYLESLQYETEHEGSAEEASIQELAQLLTLCRPQEAELMVLVYGFGFTVDEVAQDRGQPPGTIKSHLSRAKARIRGALESAPAKQKELEKVHARY